MPKFLLSVLLLAVMAIPALAEGEARPSWWPRAEKVAVEDGYGLVSAMEVRELCRRGVPMIILDARSEAEFSHKHIPDAVNLPFFSGERAAIPESRKNRLRELLGDDKNRLIIIYDNRLQCGRAPVAAYWAAKLGYGNVKRMPSGIAGWLEMEKKLDMHLSAERFQPGNQFPEVRLSILSKKTDCAYLGLAEGTGYFNLKEIRSEYVLLTLYHEMCDACHKELRQMGELMEMLKREGLDDRLKMVAIGVGSQRYQVASFRRQEGVLFPMFAEGKCGLFKELGEPLLPALYLLKMVGGRPVIAARPVGPHTDSAKLWQVLQSAMREEET